LLSQTFKVGKRLKGEPFVSIWGETTPAYNLE